MYLFGAAVSPQLVAQFSSLMENGRVYTPFGATEALPITSIGEDDIISETGLMTDQGAGACVGYPLGDAQIRIIPISDDPIPTWSDDLALPPGQLGEIVVKGSVVTRLYLHRPQKTAEAKIREGAEIWHRMGDIGYIDDKGRVWVCGRKSHRVETAQGLLLTVQCEAIFNQHSAVKRTALVGVGNYGQQTPVLIVEREPIRGLSNSQITEALLALGADYEHTRSIKTILFHDSFPVDVRHNAKIQREKLAIWAAGQLS